MHSMESRKRLMDLVDKGILAEDHAVEDPHKKGQWLSGYTVAEIARLVGANENSVGRLLKPLGFRRVRDKSTRRIKGESGRRRKVVLPPRWSPTEAENRWPLVFENERLLLEAGKSPTAIQYARRCGHIPEEILQSAVKQFDGAESHLAQRGVLVKAVNAAMQAGRQESQTAIDSLTLELETVQKRNEYLEAVLLRRESYGDITCEELDEALGRPGGNKAALLKRAEALGKRLRQSRDELARLTPISANQT